MYKDIVIETLANTIESLKFESSFHKAQFDRAKEENSKLKEEVDTLKKALASAKEGKKDA